MKRFLTMMLVLLCSAPAFAEKVAEIVLSERLDEPRGYCVDMVGSKSRADASKPLQVHTCYAYQGSIAVDQGVSVADVAKGLLRFPYFEVCLKTADVHAKHRVQLTSCDGVDAVKILWDSEGRIMPASSHDICLTAAGGPSRPGNGGSPPHLIRSLTWENCDADAKLQHWILTPLEGS